MHRLHDKMVNKRYEQTRQRDSAKVHSSSVTKSSDTEVAEMSENNIKFLVWKSSLTSKRIKTKR